jgi:hypothetical protein
MSNILSLRQASDLKKPAPYSYVLESGAQELFMFGAVHFQAPEAPQFVEMQKMWQEFKQIDSQKIVLIESYIGPISSSFENAVATSGEGGATQWLALQDGIGVLCADLEFEGMLKALSAEFDPSDVAYWFVNRDMLNWTRNPRGRSAEEVLALVLARYQKAFQKIGVAGDRAWFDAKHAQLFGTQPIDDIEFWKKVNTWSGPELFVRIIEAESHMRNEHIYGVIEHLWKLGNSIFITYGATHAIQLEPALRKLTE